MALISSVPGVKKQVLYGGKGDPPEFKKNSKVILVFFWGRYNLIEVVVPVFIGDISLQDNQTAARWVLSRRRGAGPVRGGRHEGARLGSVRAAHRTRVQGGGVGEDGDGDVAGRGGTIFLPLSGNGLFHLMPPLYE